jgi:hypothetical protein
MNRVAVHPAAVIVILVIVILKDWRKETVLASVVPVQQKLAQPNSLMIGKFQTHGRKNRLAVAVPAQLVHPAEIRRLPPSQEEVVHLEENRQSDRPIGRVGRT